MEYRRDKKGKKLSALGFGCMRFPKDKKEIEAMVINAVANGVNYFDTAFVYGESEKILGEIINKNKLRKKVYIATKLPPGKCEKYEDFEEIFNEQKLRLKTDYIDYYLIHNISSYEVWNNLLRMNIEKWLNLKKQSGEIKNIGFSFHGVQSDFLKLLDSYDWDFCQIQYNYMNENYQAGTKGLKAAAEKGLPVIIMEPLLGGKLATGLPKKAVNIFEKVNIKPAEAGLKWLWDKPEVTVVLSGMSTSKQVKENIKTASDKSPLTLNQKKAIEEVREIFKSSYKIPCTGCNYCMPCPHNVNIPNIFAAYNAYKANGMVTGFQQYITGTAAQSSTHTRLINCTNCKACIKKCPQHIPIPKELRKVKKTLEPFWFPTLLRTVKFFLDR
jgi:predicted aldo/keto reductase-like oxidoreductase